MKKKFRSKEENERIVAQFEPLSFLYSYPKQYREDYYQDCIVIILESYDELPKDSILKKIKRKIHKKHCFNLRHKNFIYQKIKKNKDITDTLDKIEYNIFCLYEDGNSSEDISKKTGYSLEMIKYIVSSIIKKLKGIR